MKKSVRSANLTAKKKKKQSLADFFSKLDLEKINQFLTILSNPAVQEIIKQMTTPPTPAPEPVVKRPRRRFSFRRLRGLHRRRLPVQAEGEM
ncbi:hypothetical protein [Brevibacillus sp. SYP-B805]|uniref:hypothetical protein n=1 Tax=Brevibacillus sp. SYP-B805 TaxID=1578199 RepID=UPI0013EB4112|nr:hypothetical protein [Brevibacillus sp. SYP-B805]